MTVTESNGDYVITNGDRYLEFTVFGEENGYKTYRTDFWGPKGTITHYPIYLYTKDNQAVALDKAALIQAITNAEGANYSENDYLGKSWKVYTEALRVANEYKDAQSGVTQSQIDRACEDLNYAVASLAQKPVYDTDNFYVEGYLPYTGSIQEGDEFVIYNGSKILDANGTSYTNFYTRGMTDSGTLNVNMAVDTVTWKVIAVGEGKFALQSKSNNYYLDLNEAKTDNTGVKMNAESQPIIITYLEESGTYSLKNPVEGGKYFSSSYGLSDTEAGLYFYKSQRLMATIKEPEPPTGTTENQPFSPNTGNSRYFRIPALVTLSDGTMVAAADARWNHTGDACSIDIMVSKSKDKGKTWEFSLPMYFNDSTDSKHNYGACFIDAVMVRDGKDKIYLMADLYPGGVAINTAPKQPDAASGYIEINGEKRLVLYRTWDPDIQDDNNYSYYVGDFESDAKEALAPIYEALADGSYSTTPSFYMDRYFYLYTADRDKMYCQQLNGGTSIVHQNVFFNNALLHVRAATYLYLITSEDGGNSWSAPMLLNSQIRKGENLDIFYGVGPGAGLWIDDNTEHGTVMLPVYTFSNQISSFIYSTDGGKTWTRSEDASTSSNWSSESCLVQLDSTTVRQFFRSGTNYVQYTDHTLVDGKWKAGSVVTVEGVTKRNSNGCQVSAIRYSKTIDGKPVILYSTPGDTSDRRNGKIYVFTVDMNTAGKPLSLVATYDIDPSATDRYAYSSITELKDSSIGILYETTNDDIIFKNIPIRELVPDILFDGENPGEDPDVDPEESTYTVSFNDIDGNVLATSQSVSENGLAQEPTAPAKTGYQFLGWKLQGTTEGLYNFANPVTGDLTLVAAWKVNAPVADKQTGSSVSVNGVITLSTEAANASIYYTTDGTAPTVSSGNLYQESIKLTTLGSTTIKAIAVAENCENSEVAEFVYTVVEDGTDIPGGGDTPGGEDTLDWGDILPKDRTGLTEVPSGIWTAGMEDLEYTGAKQTQSFRVYDGNVMLKEGTDYTVSYKNNQNAYTYTTEDLKAFEELLKINPKAKESGKFEAAKAPQVVLKMKGDYKGTKQVFFRINPYSISANDLAIEKMSAIYNAKKAQAPKPVVSWKGKALKNNKDYTFEVKNAEGQKVECKAVGEYTVTIRGTGNFSGTTDVSYHIVNDNAISKAKVKIAKSVAWKETPEEPSLDVTYNGAPMTKGTDYSVTYIDNDKVGTAYAVITGLDKYSGSKVVSYKVTGESMAKVAVEGVSKDGYPYTGEEVKLLEAESKLKIAGKSVSENDFYAVSYQKNINKGTATMVLTGDPEKGYSGTKKVTYKINTRSIKAEGIDIDLAGSTQDADDKWQSPFMKGGSKPKMIITDGTATLVEGKDFTVSYKNNKTVGQPATATIKGKGNYGDSTTVEFLVMKKELSTYADGVTVTAKDLVVKTGKNLSWKQSFKVLDEDGKALTKSEAKLAEAKYSIESLPEDYEGELTPGKELSLTTDKALNVPAGTKIKISVELQGNNYAGTATGTYRLLKEGHDISKASFSIKPQEYSGSPIEIISDSQFAKTPSLKNVGNLYLEDGENKVANIEVVEDSYVKNVNKGTAKVTLRGKGDFGGEKTVTFKIVQRDANTNWWSGLAESLQNLLSF